MIQLEQDLLAKNNAFAMENRQRWREEGDSFVPRYLELLSKGGSEDPAKACEAVGIKLDEDFWRAGNRAIEALVAEFEALV